MLEYVYKMYGPYQEIDWWILNWTGLEMLESHQEKFTYVQSAPDTPEHR
jgi:hypothetical protein